MALGKILVLVNWEIEKFQDSVLQVRKAIYVENKIKIYIFIFIHIYFGIMV